MTSKLVSLGKAVEGNSGMDCELLVEFGSKGGSIPEPIPLAGIKLLRTTVCVCVCVCAVSERSAVLQ